MRRSCLCTILLIRLATCLATGLAICLTLLPSVSAASPPVTAAAAALASRVLAAADSAGRPFAIVDKQAARLMLFHADGSLAGSSPALLGRDRGDHSVPGVGERTQTGTLRRGDATTPAGRFESEPGRNLQGEDIVWVDYGAAFAIVDKQAARLMLFHDDGSLAGSSPALLGRDRGDHSVPGVGERTQTGTLRPGDATTPAGRFESEPGRNLQGEDIVWVDYEAAFAIHRVRPGVAQAGRLRRLAASDAQGKRVSAGCVVVPVAFYERVVHPLMGRRIGVVYVLPDNG